MKKSAILSIIAAAIFWGTAGVFSKYLALYGFTTAEVAVFRMTVAAAVLCVIVFIKDRRLFKIKLRDLPVLLGLGVISLFGTSFFYLSSIEAASMSTAAILMYTAPFIVTAASVFLYKEKLTVKKSAALVTAFIGCILVSGIGDQTSVEGVVYGLLSGVTYATYSLFGKRAVKTMDTYTITLWGFIFAAGASLLTIDPLSTLSKIPQTGIKGILLILGVGIVVSVIPYLLYTYGLKYTEAGKASVIAMLEPLTATILGLVFFSQVPKVSAIFGTVLIIFAVALINDFGKTKGA